MGSLWKSNCLPGEDGLGEDGREKCPASWEGHTASATGPVLLRCSAPEVLYVGKSRHKPREVSKDWHLRLPPTRALCGRLLSCADCAPRCPHERELNEPLSGFRGLIAIGNGPVMYSTSLSTGPDPKSRAATVGAAAAAAVRTAAACGGSPERCDALRELRCVNSLGAETMRNIGLGAEAGRGESFVDVLGNVGDFVDLGVLAKWFTGTIGSNKTAGSCDWSICWL